MQLYEMQRYLPMYGKSDLQMFSICVNIFVVQLHAIVAQC